MKYQSRKAKYMNLPISHLLSKEYHCKTPQCHKDKKLYLKQLNIDNKLEQEALLSEIQFTSKPQTLGGFYLCETPTHAQLRKIYFEAYLRSKMIYDMAI